MNKVKKGFVSDDLDVMDSSDVESFNINYPENITSVDPSALVSLTVGLTLFRNAGVNKIIVPDFLPVRFNAKGMANEVKASFMQDEKEKEVYWLEQDIQQARINRNIVDKKIRSFRRLASHFTFLDVLAFPKELDDSMHITINDYYCCNNEVLDQIYTAVDKVVCEKDKRM